MKIATWNINSVRLRLDLVLEFLEQADIDILCLQETKTKDEFFSLQRLWQMLAGCIPSFVVRNHTMVLQ